MTLYEIDQGIIDALEAAIDEDTGEIINEAMYERYEALQMDRDQKIENIVLFIKDLDAEASAVYMEKISMDRRYKALKNKAESLKKYLAYALDGSKFKTPRCMVNYRSSEQVIVDDVAIIPEEFMRMKEPEVDKAKLKMWLKLGNEISGAHIEKCQNIQIK